MKQVYLLDTTENTHLVEQEERNKFLYSVLTQMGIPISEFWKDPISLSPEEKLLLRNTLNKFAIQLIDNAEVLEIYVENQVVGFWKKPLYSLKRDLSKLERNKQLYLEMAIETWSVFDQ